MERNFFVDRVFRLFFDAPDTGSGGGGGDVGDVGDIAHGQEGDVRLMERAGEGGDDDDDADDDEGAGAGGEETFDQVDEGDEGGDDEEEELDAEGKPIVKEGKEKEGDEEVFEGRPTLTDIKKKYPKIFKEFPDLREVLFRENEFGKHFGTVEEAEVASTQANSFRTIEAALLGGDPSIIIDQLGDNDPAALAKVVDNFLPKILAKSQDLYLRAATPIIEQFMFTAFEHGKTTGNANLMKSMQHAAQFFTGKPDIPDPSRRANGNRPHPAETELEKKQQEWAQTRFKEASSEVSQGIDADLDADIIKGLDPDKKLSDRQRKNLVKDIKDEIDAQLEKDEAFKRQMKALWKKAADANYPKEQRASIKTAFLARAKALVPSVRSRLRAEWFGEKPANSGGKPGDKKGQQTPPKKRSIPNSGQAAAGRGNRPPKANEVDYTKTSDLDLIEGRFTRKS